MSADLKKLLNNEKEFADWASGPFYDEASKDGLLDQIGLNAALGKLDLGDKKPTEEDVQKYLKELGKNKVNYNEYCAYLKKIIS